MKKHITTTTGIFVIPFTDRFANTQALIRNLFISKVLRITFLGFFFFTYYGQHAFTQGKAERIAELIQNTQSENDSIVFDAWRDLFLNYIYKDLDTANMYLGRLGGHVEKMDSDRHRATLYTLHAIWFRNQKKYDSAKRYYQIAIGYNTKINRKRGLADIYNSIGEMMKRLKQYDSALIYYKKAEAINLELNYRYGLEVVYNNLGVFYDNIRGDYPKALESFYLALKLGEADPHIHPVLRLNIGNMLSKTGQLEEAEKELFIAIDLLKKSNSWKHLSKAHDILSDIYHGFGDHENAIQHIELSVAYRERLKDPELTFDAKNDLIRVYTTYKLWDKALVLLQENLQRINEVPFSEESKVYYAVNTHLQLALCYYETDKLSAASSHLSASEQYVIPRKRLISSKFINIVDLKCEIYEKLGLHKEALHFYKQKLSLNDSLLSEENRYLIAELKTQYETEKKEQEISSLQQAAEIQSLEIERKNNQILIGGLLFIVTVGGGLIYSRQKRIKREKASLELEQRFLRSQLNPHFIFNSMGAIQQYLLTESAEKASDYMSLFGRLMRQILENSREPFITLEEEVSMLRNYLELQQLRFQHAFDYMIELDDTLDAAYDGIPPMFAQPFIENALEHGLFKKDQNKITIRFSKVSNDLIQLEIVDSGTGVTEKQSSINYHESLATKITNERLERMRVTFKASLTLNSGNITNDAGEIEGYRVRLSLPSRLVAA